MQGDKFLCPMHMLFRDRASDPDTVPYLALDCLSFLSALCLALFPVSAGQGTDHFQYLPPSHNTSSSISYQPFCLFLMDFCTRRNHRFHGRPICLSKLHCNCKDLLSVTFAQPNPCSPLSANSVYRPSSVSPIPTSLNTSNNS
jgi:hypothetical protein